VIEVQEFPQLARKYQVRGVPMTVLNDGEALVGAVPPMHLVDAVERAGREE
jgi:predicted DsbA family dithiol-disulfide isomerase